MAIRPVDIARRLNISTTTLRKYEEIGLLPPVPRSASGYRVYTHEHVAYFICIREMLLGFDLTRISRILSEVMKKRIDTALWMANKEQAKLYQERIISKKIISNLGQATEQKKKYSGLITINEVSRETGVSTTTIRYWDKIGLISPERNAANNYRMFTPLHIKQILIIYALKFTFQAKGQKHFIALIKDALKEFDYNDRNRISAMKNDIEKYLNKVNRAQIRGVAALYDLCIQVEKNQFI